MTAAGDVYTQGLPRAARRAAGAFYTPPALVARVVEECISATARRILDPACGDGRFLVAARDALIARGVDPLEAERGLVGVDRDPAAIALARTLLPLADLRVGEALAGERVEPRGYDVVLGNPPYLRSPAVRQSDPRLWTWLRGRLAATSHGEWDLSCAFVERALDWLAPGGRLGFVVPSRWLSARAASGLRALLAERRLVRRIVDFGAAQVFPGATTYASLLFVDEAGAPHVELERSGETHALAYEDLGAEPWLLASPASELQRLRAAGPPLARLARIAKGAGSNADGVFLVPPGTPHACRVPAIRGRDVRPYAIAHARDALLPYDGDRLLAPDELPDELRAHFAAHRDRLEAREARRFAGDTFYRWGRPQNLRWLRERTAKLVVPDAAASGRAAVDDEGRLVIDTAYAIRPLSDATPIGLLLAVLNSPIVARWLGATGIPLRGGYFRMKTAYLSSLPVPDPATPAARELARDALAGRAPEELAERTLALY